MAENLLLSLQITLLGMGIVFGAICLLWGLMALMTSLLAEKGAPDEKSADVEAGDDLRVRAAAVAVTVLLEQQSLSAHPLPEPPTAVVSAWQIGMRSRQMYQKGNIRR